MKNRYLNILIVGLFSLLSVSCTKYLDIKPYGKTIPKTAEELSALLHNHLNKIDAGTDNILVGNPSQIITWDTACGDDFEVCLTSSGGKNLPVFLGQVAVSASSSTIYRGLYTIIRDCNIVLHDMKESSTVEAKEVKATAYALRAVSYYQLLKYFCEKPQLSNLSKQIGLSLVLSFDMEEKPIRSSMDKTINLIEEDLKESLKYKMNNPIYRFTEDVVKGYLARLYFWTQQWEKALSITQELNDKYPLLNSVDYDRMMKTSYDLTGNQLLKSNRAIDFSGSTILTESKNSIKFRPVSRRFIDHFNGNEKVTDVRYSLWINKQRESSKTFFSGMRGAEFKLIEAECLYHLKRDTDALKAINELRSHRINGYVDLTMGNLPDIIDSEIIKEDALGNPLTKLSALILSERRKELFLEGDRFFELKRNGTPEYWITYNGLKYTILPYMYTLPIPINDFDLIEGIVQNPGYVEFTN